MLDGVNHELEFVRRFVVPSRRQRYLSLLQSRKGRSKLIEALNHFRDLDMRRASLVPPNAQTIDRIEARLRQKGAPDHCYIASSNRDIDQSEMLLREALEQIVGGGLGTIISCIPGKLAYFEGEEQNSRYILEYVE